jgi:hypothetical protein
MPPIEDIILLLDNNFLPIYGVVEEGQMKPLSPWTRVTATLMSILCGLLGIAFGGISALFSIAQFSESIWPNGVFHSDKVCRQAHGGGAVSLPTPERWPIIHCPYDPAPDAISSVIDLIPVIALTWALLSVSLCFVRIARGDYFSSNVSRRFRNFALGGLVYFFTLPLEDDATNFILHVIRPSMFNQVITGDKGNILFTLYGQPESISVSRVMIIIYAVTVAIVAALISRAAVIEEENRQIV